MIIVVFALPVQNDTLIAFDTKHCNQYTWQQSMNEPPIDRECVCFASDKYDLFRKYSRVYAESLRRGREWERERQFKERENEKRKQTARVGWSVVYKRAYAVDIACGTVVRMLPRRLCLHQKSFEWSVFLLHNVRHLMCSLYRSFVCLFVYSLHMILTFRSVFLLLLFTAHS